METEIFINSQVIEDKYGSNIEIVESKSYQYKLFGRVAIGIQASIDT